VIRATEGGVDLMFMDEGAREEALEGAEIRLEVAKTEAKRAAKAAVVALGVSEERVKGEERERVLSSQESHRVNGDREGTTVPSMKEASALPRDGKEVRGGQHSTRSSRRANTAEVVEPVEAAMNKTSREVKAKLPHRIARLIPKPKANPDPNPNDYPNLFRRSSFNGGHKNSERHVPR